MKLCDRWPRCNCICRGFLNKNEANSCGIKPREQKENKKKVDERDLVDQIWDATS